LNPRSDNPEYTSDPRHEFNFWFDPEAAHIVLRASWPRIDLTPIDVTVNTAMTQAMVDEIAKSASPAARYIAAWSQQLTDMWDEIAACAWIDPAIIAKETPVYVDVDLSHGPSYGDTLAWPEPLKPATGAALVHAQLELDKARFQKLFVGLVSRMPGTAAK